MPSLFSAFTDQTAALNTTTQLALSLGFLIIGMLLLEWLLYYLRAWIRKTRSDLQKPDVWRLNAIRLPVRLAGIAVLIRLARMPLSLPDSLVLTLRAVEIGLPALAALVFIIYGFSVLTRLVRELPVEISQAFPEYEFGQMRRVVLLTAAIALAGLTAMALESAAVSGSPFYFWWLYGLSVLGLLILFLTNRLIGRFNTRVVLLPSQTEDTGKLHLVLRAILWPLRMLLTAGLIFFTARIPGLTTALTDVLDMIALTLGLSAVFVFFYRLLDLVEYRLKQFVKKEDNLFDDNFVQLVRLFSRFGIIVIGAIIVIQTVSGKPLSALMAGLGIGGLALALAAQDTLKNLFGGFMIMMDKPFNMGERVVVEGKDGVVEKIGFRSTRIRTLTGHLVTVPNEKMAGNNVENISKRPHIRRLANITITYDTPPAKVERALEIVRGILDNHEGMNPDFPPRVFFNEFNDASLNLLVIYWFHPNDFWAFCRFSEEVNLKIMQAFEAEGIEFAFPTQTTYLAHDPRRPLQIGWPGAPLPPEA